MIFSNNVRKMLLFLMLLVFPMNIRIILQSSTLVQEMVGVDHTAPSQKNSTAIPNYEEGTPAIASTENSQPQANHVIVAESQSEEGPSTIPSQIHENGKEIIIASNQEDGIPQPKEENQLTRRDEQKLDDANTNIIPSKDDPNTFSACLQIMDDNHFLIEWIAYHYHVMPLRRLIVFTDPHSVTSPQHILDRWNRDRINITLWDNESHLYPKGKRDDSSKNYTKLFEHRSRQRQFVRRCLQTLYKEGREWVLLSDTDEYAMIHHERVRNSNDPLSPMIYAPGKNVTIPDQEHPGSVLQFLQNKDTMFPHTGQTLWDIPCLTVARKVFGTKEHPSVPESFMGFNPYDFQTLRWRRYGKDPRPGKSIVNLKRIKYNNILPHPSIHRPLSDDLCKGKMWLPEDKSVIVINHYPGNLKQMLFRKNDARGSDTNATAYRIKRFKEHRKYSKFTETEMINQWLPGFIKAVGQNEANRLLEHVGLPEEASVADNSVSTVDQRQLMQTAASTPEDTTQANKAAISLTQASSSEASKNDPNSFAACLQIMDDNHFLIEWLAYHYHVMPLRRLIVLTDKHSQTSPSPILDRWKYRMNITLWTEKDVYPHGIPPPPDKKKVPTRLGQHRSRQRHFTKLCLQQLHREGREWVLVTDTDEYTMVSDRVRNPEDELSPLKDAERALTIPSHREPGSVLKLLQIKEIVIPHTGQHLFDNPCITMSRKTFGTKTMDSPKKIFGLSSADFQTLNWRYYVDDGKPGKTLINLKFVKYKDIPNYPSVHRPLTKEGICAGPISLREHRSIFVTNHYPGNLDQMLFRVHDARGNFTNATAYRIDRFNSHKKLAKHFEPETIQEWLPGFIESVGEREAKELLKFVGIPQLAAYSEAPQFSESEQNEMAAAPSLSYSNNLAPMVKPPLQQSTMNGLTRSSQLASFDDPNSFSACLYVKDANHKHLIEWIAYHYHVMPLRRLVIFSDPESRTSLEPVLWRWQDHIKISLWDDDKYVFPNGNGIKHQGSMDSDEWRQRYRQRQFVRRCLFSLREEERQWVLLTASDEFTTINDRARSTTTQVPSPLKCDVNNMDVPSHEEPGSVLKLLKRGDATAVITGHRLNDTPCIMMSRKQFGPKVSNVASVMPGLSVSDLKTFVFKYYVDNARAGKSMVNLSLIDLSDIEQNPQVNRPFKSGEICRGPSRLKEKDSVFVVHRYAGKVEDNTNEHDMLYESGTIHKWLSGFIASVGEEEAGRLLTLDDQAKSAVVPASL